MRSLIVFNIDKGSSGVSSFHIDDEEDFSTVAARIASEEMKRKGNGSYLVAETVRWCVYIPEKTVQAVPVKDPHDWWSKKFGQVVGRCQ